MNNQLIEKLKCFFRERADEYRIGAAFIFGSFAEGMDRVYSDIDIAVYFSKDLTHDEIISKITELNLEIVNTIHREIDIIWIDHEFSKPMLYYNAIVKGVPLYYDSRERYIDLFLKALYEKEDFSRWGPLWQEEIAKKRLERIK